MATKLKKVTEHVWEFVLFKLKLVPTPVPKGVAGISKNVFQNLAMTIWTETYVSLSLWKGYIYENSQRMIESNEQYASFVIYACYVEHCCSREVCESFVRVMSVVIQMALYTSEDQQVELLEYSREIWLWFFERELQNEFNEKGGWKKLHTYLEQKKPTKLFKSVEKLENEMKFPQQIVEELQLAPPAPTPETCIFQGYIKVQNIEHHKPTMRILKSMESVLENIRLKHLPPEADDAEISPGKKSISADQHPKKVLPKEKTKGEKVSEDVFDQPLKLPPIQRVSTRQTYLRAKEMLRILQKDFIKLAELIEFLYRLEFPENS